MPTCKWLNEIKFKYFPIKKGFNGLLIGQTRFLGNIFFTQNMLLYYK